MPKAAPKPVKKQHVKPIGARRHIGEATRKRGEDAIVTRERGRDKVIHVAHSSAAGRIVRVRRPLSEEDYGFSEDQLARFTQALHDQAEQDAKEGRVIRYQGKGHLAKLLRD